MDVVRGLLADQIVLLHVIDSQTADVVSGARAELLAPGLADAGTAAQASIAAQTRLLDAAEARLGRHARRDARQGRPEREVMAACAGAGLLVLARDGDRTRLGPRTIGPRTRFVIDHASCQDLLIWPTQPPDLATMPSPQPSPSPPPPPPAPRPEPPGRRPPEPV